MRKFFDFALITLMGLVLFAGCAAEKPWAPGEKLAKEKIKLGILYFTNLPAEHAGYSFSHERGIRNMQQELGLQDSQIIRKANVSDADMPELENVIRDCIADGANIIIATSYGYMDSCEKMAAEFPGVIFAHATGNKYNDTNFTNYYGRMYQAMYLSGIAAGMKTRTGRIGYVAAMEKSNSQVTGFLDSFALGVERANSRAKILVRVIYNWYDPMLEKNAARSLIDAGCDVIAQGTDSAIPQIEAEKAGVWGVGFNSDLSGDAPGAVLTSAVYNWEVYYTMLVRSVIEGTFTTKPYFGGIGDGFVSVIPLSAFAAPGTEELIEREKQRMLNEGFNVFDGILETNDGKTIGESGATLSDSEITENMNWYYRNILEEQES
ncbi:BMP family ABC transporter substrate-binding protein [Spirochaetia bacterium]|nr:BMP family ABC transporter substrate-binding protein [Spirochaetia bacterium]